MATTKKKNQFIHTLKGPERLAPEVIREIVESRGIQGARSAMAKKHGISELRVGKIWIEFYGGGKLSDYKSGLKKPLPTEPITGNLRKVRTSRAEYQAREPKFGKLEMNADQQTRAKPSKVRRDDELETFTDDVDSITDNQAEIIAGQIGAGNNNPELLEIFERLIESRDRDTEYLYKLAKRGLGKKYSDDTDYETDNIDTIEEDTENDTENDDSTISYRRERPQRLTTRTATSRDDTNASMVLRDNFYKPVEGLHSQYQGERARVAPNRTGFDAVPQRSRDTQFRDAQQDRTYQTVGNEQEIYRPQYYPSERGVQQNNAYNNTKCPAQSGASADVPWKSGVGQCKTVEGLPWLKIKPY